MSLNYVVKLSPELIQYLHKKNKTCLTLDITLLGGGCCASFESEEISFSIPKDHHFYHQVEVEGIKIFLTKKARVLTPVLFFKLRTSFFVKSVIVEGIDLRR